MPHFKNIYWYLLFLGTLLGAQDKEPYDWYAYFYESLSQQEIKSIRYFQLWVAPGKNSPQEVLPIGGSQKNFELWLESTEEFLSSKEIYRQVWDGNFIYEITVDKNVYEKHQTLFENLKEKYDPYFEVSLIEDYQPKEAMSQMIVGYEQCLCGIASVCSDYWRFAHSQKEDFEVNIYADIDTLSQSIKTKKGRSDHNLGLNPYGSSGIYVPFFWTPSQLHWNTDILIFKNVSDLTYKKIQALFEDTLQKQALSFEHILKQQSQLQKIKFYEEYLDYLDRRLQLFLSQPQAELNRYQLIMFGIGPGFWLGMTQQNLANPYWHGASDNVDNYFSWVLKDIQESYESANGTLIDTLYSFEDKVNIIKMTIMLYDRAYLKKHNLEWSASLEAGFRSEVNKNQKILKELPAQLNFLKKNTESFFDQ